MQIVSSGIWTQVTMSIYYDNNYYTTSAYKYFPIRHDLELTQAKVNKYLIGP